MTSPETGEELRARRLLERELHVTVERVAETDVPTVDYRAPSAAIGAEVKRVTSRDFLDLEAAFRSSTSVDSQLLTQRWTVMIHQPTLATTIAAMPRFPDDDEEFFAKIEAGLPGYTVQRKADREAEWRAQNTGPRTPRLKGLGRAVEPHLAVLEANNITTNRGLGPFDPRPGVTAAAWEIDRLSRGALCMSRATFTWETPGVDIALTSSAIRTGSPDVVVGRIQLWLDSDLSENLRASLANEAPGTERHAVLVFDRTEPELHSADEQGIDFRPTLTFTLPAEIDVVWFILGPVASCFRAGVWTTHPAGP